MANLKTVFVPPAIILDLINYTTTPKDMIRVLKIKDLPTDVDIKDIFYDPMRACFGIMLQHDSFADVKCGQLIPELETITEVLEVY